MSARGLLEDLHRELAPVEQAIRAHRYLAAPPPEESLRAFAGEQYTILRSDRRSFAHLAARFPEPPAADFFLGLAQGEGEALERLFALAASLGIDEGGLIGYEPKPGCQAYTAFVSWLALGGSRAELAVADQGLTAGDSPARARRAARLLQAYELLFWGTLADAL